MGPATAADPGIAAPPHPHARSTRVGVIGLLRPHWKAMTVALAGVGVEAVAALLEPWPLKIVLDALLQSTPLPGWMLSAVSWMGGGTLGVINFAVLAAATIAVGGAVSGYLRTYAHHQRRADGSCTTCGRRSTTTSSACRSPFTTRSRTGDLISRVTTDMDAIQDFVSSALLGIVANALTLVGMMR